MSISAELQWQKKKTGGIVNDSTEDPFGILDDENHPDIANKQILVLQKRIAELEDSRKEERFLSVVCAVILLNLLFWYPTGNWAVPVATLILQLFVLIPLAKRYGMESIVELGNKILVGIKDTVKSKDS